MLRSRSIGILSVLLSSLAVGGCSVSDLAGNLAGSAAGGRAGEITRAAVGGVSDMQTQMLTRFSPEQEATLGRAAAAEILGRYGLDPNETHQEYVRLIGASIVELSSRLTGMYDGYHFAVLDSDEPNGWSAPGGFVFITRGALLRAQTEDEVAGILAHELAHISLKHAESIIIRGRESGLLAGAMMRIGAAAANAANSGVNRGLTDLLGDSARTYVGELVRTGYGRDAELEADREGTLILYDVGYDASSIQDYLKAGPNRSEGTWSQHPPAALRIRSLEPVVKAYGGTFGKDNEKAARTARFHQVREGAASGVLAPPEEVTYVPEGETVAPESAYVPTNHSSIVPLGRAVPEVPRTPAGS